MATPKAVSQEYANIPAAMDEELITHMSHGDATVVAARARETEFALGNDTRK
jgi:hypothetical protein